jgi:hypothetical protein
MAWRRLLAGETRADRRLGWSVLFCVALVSFHYVLALLR